MPAVTIAQYHTQVNDRAELAAGKNMGRKPFSFGAAAFGEYFFVYFVEEFGPPFSSSYLS